PQRAHLCARRRPDAVKFAAGKRFDECRPQVAARNSEHHDGFHVISSTWRLTRVAQYFSPPIIPDAQIDRSKRFGGRYLAALFGSGIPGVLASGIASEGFGIAVFRGGKETFFEDLR